MAKSKFDMLNEIVTNQQMMKVTEKINNKNRKIILDLFTASFLLSLFKQVPDETRQKLESLSWLRLANFAHSKLKG